MGSIIKTPNAPYHDDFDEKKKFLRVLFRPGFAVQTREANQLQSIINDQLGSLGESFFQEGQKVVGGEVSISNKAFVKLSTPLSRTSDSVYEGAHVVNASNTISGVIAKIARSEGADPDTLYVEYASVSSADSSIVSFLPGEDIFITLSDGSTETRAVASENATGYATLVSVLEGIYFIYKQFVLVDAQTTIVTKYEIAPASLTSTIGFELIERLVTPEEDNSLLDNALGSPNETAPGAHRLQILAELKDINDAVNVDKFIKIVTLSGDKAISQTRDNNFSVFEDTLARRTYEESGNYVIDDFLIEVREDFDNGSNHGLSPTGDPTKIGIVLDPGKAYVRGYEVQVDSPTVLITDKSRTTETRSELLIDGSYQSAFIVSAPVNSPALFSRIQLSDSSGVIGTAFVRSFSYQNTVSGVERFRLDFFNPVITDSGKTLNDVTSISSTVNSFTATVEVVDYNPNNTSNIFPIPFGFVENVSDVDLEYIREYVGTVNGTELPITCAVNDQFQSSIDSYVVVIGSSVKRPVSVTRSSGNTQATLDVSNFGSVNGQSAKVLAVTSRNGAVPRFKSLVEITETRTAANFITLGKVDAQSLTSIKIGSVDYTRYYSLDGGQRDTQYDLATLTLNAGMTAPVGNLEITYKYFDHGAGDFFGPQSYENIPYENIPYYTDAAGDRYFLGSVLDFRPKYQSSTAYELSGAQTLKYNEDISTSFAYYLSRKDKVCLDRTGKFTIVTGVPGVNPSSPKDLDAAITLYEINIPAFTFKASDVRATKFNLRRYTMKDISNLENRIENLEYVSALSLLEADANQKELIDKFKCGFVVDNFKTANVGDYDNPGHQIGFDFNKGEMRPLNTTKSVQMGFAPSLSSGFVRTGNAITLPFTEKRTVAQLLASSVERLQPYTLFNFNGNTVLTPAEDVWVSTEQLPDVVIQNNTVISSTTTRLNANIFNQWFGWWSSRLSTVSTIISSSSEILNTAVQFTAIPYIRSRSVQFEAIGLKPNSKVTPFFDGVNVSAYVRPAGGSLGSPLIVSGAGTLTGVFELPNTAQMRFRTGKRKFILSDGGINPDTSSTFTEAVYYADGTLKTVQNTVLQNNTISNVTYRRVDPLAQSFSIDEEGGSFVTSIEVFFGPDAVSNTDSVSLEIRGMTNGSPNETLIARKILQPSSIVGSLDATVGTKFVFDSPVFLEQDVEYCFVLLSNSLTLTTWVATLGEKTRMPGDNNANTGQVISKQPFIGSLFKSQNNLTWTPAQTQDLKFAINTAVFNTSVVGRAVFENIVPAYDVGSEADPFLDTLGFDPFAFQVGSTTVRVTHPNHSFKNGDSVTFSGPVTGSMNGVPVSEIYTQKLVSNVDIDSYDITVTTPSDTLGVNGGTGTKATSYVEMSTVYLNSEDLVLNQTAVSYGIRSIDRATGVIDAAYFPVENLDNTNLETTHVVKVSGDRSCLLQATFSSSVSNLSPVLDISKVNVVAVKNRISDVQESLSSDSGSAARYLQKSITLVNPANEITVFADVNRPVGSSVEIFYKVGQADVSEQGDWIQLPASGIQSTTGAQDEFKEYKWTVNVPGDFYAVKLKIVLRSANEAKVPRMKNLRSLFLYT